MIGCLGFGACLFAAMGISHQAPAVVIFCVANVFFMPVIPSLYHTAEYDKIDRDRQRHRVL